MPELKNEKRMCDVVLLVKEYGSEPLQFIVCNIPLDTAYRFIHVMADIKGEKLADVIKILEENKR